MRRALLSALLVLAVVSWRTSQAHEVRPGYLEIVQPEQESCRVVWKRPVMGDLALRLIPRLSTGWLDRSPDDQYASAGFLIQTWTIHPCTDGALAGMTVVIDGLDKTITDVFVRIRLWNGWREDVVLRPDSTQFGLPTGFQGSSGVPGYLKLGFDHILSGVDHLLFVLGLILLIRDRWMLLKAVTAFTVAHSITLACALILGLSLPGGFVEVLIALSILFLGAEVLHARRGGKSFTIRFPWAAAFLFGLFHGMGFAGGLAALGYAQQDLAAALVFFNLGVELGQIGFIGVVLVLGWLATKLAFVRTELIARVPACVVGIAGAFWTIRASLAWLEGR